jgi:hypothetical protein
LIRYSLLTVLQTSLRSFRLLTAVALLAGLALVQCSTSDEAKDDARDCCSCLANNRCWDFDQCPTTADCVCSLRGSACATDPPCFVVDQACREERCGARCEKFP